MLPSCTIDEDCLSMVMVDETLARAERIAAKDLQQETKEVEGLRGYHHLHYHLLERIYFFANEH